MHGPLNVTFSHITFTCDVIGCCQPVCPQVLCFAVPNRTLLLHFPISLLLLSTLFPTFLSFCRFAVCQLVLSTSQCAAAKSARHRYNNTSIQQHIDTTRMQKSKRINFFKIKFSCLVFIKSKKLHHITCMSL